MSTQTTGEGYERILKDHIGVDNIRRRTGDRRKPSDEAGPPVKHLWSCGLPFFPSPEGEGKSRLGGEQRLEEL
jgi:hypothetical protein